MNNEQTPERVPNELPAVPPTPLEERQVPLQQPRPSRKKWLLPLIIGLVLVVLGGGAALAYKVWYQNPEKVVSDAMMHALEAKSATYTGSFGAEQSGTKVSIDFDGTEKDSAHQYGASVAIEGGGMKYEFKAGAILASDGTIYAKVSNIDVLMKEIRKLMPVSELATFDSLISKVNDHWIKISDEKIKNFSKELSTAKTCLQDAYKTLQTDKDYSSELVELYKKHPFVKIDKQLGEKDGSLGYEIIQSPAETKEFNKLFKDTKLFKKLHDCDNSVTSETTERVTNSVADTMEVWVSKWSHEITKMTVSTSADGVKGNMLLEPKWNTGKSVEIPKDTTDVDALVPEVERLTTSLFGGLSFSESTTLTPMTPVAPLSSEL